MTILFYLGIAAISLPLVFIGFTQLLAVLTWLRWPKNQQFYSALYHGRVSHTRFHPTVHSFSYPFFWMAVELNQEADKLFWGRSVWWPLSIIMSLRTTDHYKNGEGLDKNTTTTRDLAQCTLNLVTERTKNKEFTLHVSTHRVILVTHLSYYGYCFNPVSFYYILNKQDDSLHAIVAEVSNTPWNEMQCYVLCRDSVDMKRVTQQASSQHNFLFPKTFHVSPFMEMTYNYDWTFVNMPSNNNNSPLEITTSMMRITATNDTNLSNNNNALLQFRAHVKLQREELHPLYTTLYLLKFPFYCVMVQLWIHYEAFWLFVKGVKYQPHPNEIETTASKIIGQIMTPLFQLKDWIDQKRASKKEE